MLKAARSTRRMLFMAGLAVACTFVMPAAFAQSYPAKAVRVIVTSAPGGSADTLSRLLFGRLSEDLGQQFIIENRAGGGGTIGASAVAQAPADGYTILFDSTAFAVNPTLHAKLPYDTFKDFQPVFQVGRIPLLLVIHPSVKANSVADIVAIAKASPDGIAWASAGVGSIQHMLLEMFAKKAGVKLNHVVYKGGGPAMIDLVAGHVQFYFSNTAMSTPYVKKGMIRAVGQTTNGRLAAFPELAPVSDLLPGFNGSDWLGVFVRSGTPPEIIAALNAGLNKTLQVPMIKERLSGLTVEFGQNTPAEFGAFVRAEAQQWEQIIRQANIKLE